MNTLVLISSLLLHLSYSQTHSFSTSFLRNHSTRRHGGRPLHTPQNVLFMSSPSTSKSHDLFSSSGTSAIIIKQPTKHKNINLLLNHLLPLPIQRIGKSCQSSSLLGFNNGIIHKQYLYVLMKMFAWTIISSTFLLLFPLPAFAKRGGGSSGGGGSSSGRSRVGRSRKNLLDICRRRYYWNESMEMDCRYDL